MSVGPSMRKSQQAEEGLRGSHGRKRPVWILTEKEWGGGGKTGAEERTENAGGGCGGMKGSRSPGGELGLNRRRGTSSFHIFLSENET